jgi:hypothetical protein
MAALPGHGGEELGAVFVAAAIDWSTTLLHLGLRGAVTSTHASIETRSLDASSAPCANRIVSTRSAGATPSCGEVCIP